MRARPEPLSLAEAVKVTWERYQPFACSPDSEPFTCGGRVSTCTLWLISVTSSAWSWARKVRVCTPSSRVSGPVQGCSAEAFQVQVKVSMPEPGCGSEAEAESMTGETYQPASPITPLRLPSICGGRVSTRALRLPICELSPQLESVQNVKLFSPSSNGTPQAAPLQAKASPLRAPSMSRMSYPETGSLAVRKRMGAVMHQPF